MGDEEAIGAHDWQILGHRCMQSPFMLGQVFAREITK